MNLLTLFLFRTLLANETSGLDIFFLIITNFGSEVFYMVLIPPIYWCISKKFGFRLFILSSLAAFISTAIKNIIRLPRPPAHLWKDTPQSFAFPSGHAQGSTTFWTYIILYTRQKIIFIVGFVLIVLIGASRIYLGVHYPGDVYAGIALGICTALLFIFFEPKVTRIVNTWSFEQKVVFSAIIPILFLIFSSFFYSVDDRGIQLSGAFLGILIGYVLEAEYINFSVHTTTKTKLLRIFVGLFLAFLAYFGLGFGLADNIVTGFFRSWLGGFTVIFIAPWVFSKIERSKNK